MMLAGNGRREISAALGVGIGTADMYMWAVRKASGTTPLYVVDDDDDTPPRVIRARIAADVASGVRCPRCHLLLPCDHQ